MSTYQMIIDDYKRNLLINDRLQASLERGKFSPTIETAIVDSRLEGIAWDEHPSEELCDDYNCGCHDDCDSRDCEVCFDAAIDRADRAMDEEMGK